MESRSNHVPTSQLLREHIGIVHRVVAQLARRLPQSVSRDDLIAAGTLGLYEALKKGVPENPAMFVAYASIRVRGAIMDELRRLDWFPRRRRQQASVDASPETPATGRATRSLVRIDDLEASQPLASDSDGPGEHLERKLDFLALQSAISALPAREREIIVMRYFRGLSGKTVATELGLSEARVSQLHARAIDLLRRNVEDDADLPLAA